MIDRLSLIERWWRVVPDPALSRKITWTPEEPKLEAAWEGATVHGPFVPEADYRGAVAVAELADQFEWPCRRHREDGCEDCTACLMRRALTAYRGR